MKIDNNKCNEITGLFGSVKSINENGDISLKYSDYDSISIDKGLRCIRSMEIHNHTSMITVDFNYNYFMKNKPISLAKETILSGELQSKRVFTKLDLNKNNFAFSVLNWSGDFDREHKNVYNLASIIPFALAKETVSVKEHSFAAFGEDYIDFCVDVYEINVRKLVIALRDLQWVIMHYSNSKKPILLKECIYRYNEIENLLLTEIQSGKQKVMKKNIF